MMCRRRHLRYAARILAPAVYTRKHFSSRASLAALRLRLRRLGLLDAIASTVKVPQKTVRHTPAEKLYNAFLAILSGAHGLSEINTRLRADPTQQRAFGRATCLPSLRVSVLTLVRYGSASTMMRKRKVPVCCTPSVKFTRP